MKTYNPTSQRYEKKIIFANLFIIFSFYNIYNIKEPVNMIVLNIVQLICIIIR